MERNTVSDTDFIKRINQATSEFKISTVRSKDGSLTIRYGVRYLGSGKPRAYILFLNGRSEWLEKYSYLHSDLCKKEDIAFVTMDHRGQGNSGGTRAYVRSYDDYAQDVATVVEEVIGTSPYVLVTHSMGGLIGLYGTLTGVISPKVLALSSPLLEFPNNPVPRPLARPLSKLISKAGFGNLSTGGGNFADIRFEDNKLTHHPELYARMAKNPYPIPGATFEWVKATFAALSTVYDAGYLEKLQAPTLILGGTKEEVVDPIGFTNWTNKASSISSVPVKYLEIEGAKHEMLAELPIYYDQVISAIRDWISEVI